VCLLLALARGSADGELWVAANRDERLDRPWAPPSVIVPDPPVFGGRDLIGGGSWLAVNLASGFVVAVTNARRGALPRERSRGALVVDLATERTVPEALGLLSELDLGRYGLFNLFLADARERWVATNHPAPRIERATSPVVAIGNDPLDAPSDRVARAAERAVGGLELPADVLRTDLERLLADHDGADPLCRHGDSYGTVCSAVVALTGSAVVTYRFAAGPPCTSAFADVPVPSYRPREGR
jgi:uncharacterized protein with NRDE domain